MTAFTALYEAQLVAVLVVLARVGTALMFLPGFGETQVPRMHRLTLALLLSIGLRGALPVTLPETPMLLGALLAREALVGLYLGLGARIIFTVLHTLGSIVSFSTSLSNAMAAGNTGYEGSSAISSLLMVAGVALIFVTDVHHLMLRAIFHSYDLLPPAWLPLGDLALQVTRLAIRSLYIAAMLGAPFFVLGILYNLGLGVANRVMPNMPVMFVAGPATVILGLVLLYLTQEALLERFSDLLAEFLMTLTVEPS